MYEVYVTHVGFNPKLDEELANIAKQHNGTMTGSGITLMNHDRDITFEFSKRKEALAFFRVMKSRIGADITFVEFGPKRL